ncbi:MAG: protein-glutamate O-methyltransferase CheR [Kiritimatiellia bacterium]|nr:protein-glutamate O-methyltransferase CheR [Kiritimatiellia bacterium]
MATDNKFLFLLEKIRRNKGVDFSLYREGTLRRRIDSRLRTTGCNDYLEYVSYLNRNPEEYDRLIEAVTINVTEFFRNPETFRAIQQKVLPEIIKGQQEQAKKPIRAWCAGASYGEETYSIAILLLQVLQERIADYNIKVLGTDIDPDCIAKAKTGLYEPSHLKAVGKHILGRYFFREGNNYRVNDEVRQLTEFKQHNLTHWNFEDASREAQSNKAVIPAEAGIQGPWLSSGRQNKYPDSHSPIKVGDKLHGNDRKRDEIFKNTDLILCRNVVIYFTKPLQAYVYNLFAKCLKPGGFLVLGKVESLGGHAQGFFETVDNKERIYRKT